MTNPPRRVVVIDANVLINLIHVARLDICGELAGLEFVVPDHVNAEIADPNQRTILDEALKRGIFRLESIVDPDAIRLFADLTLYLGKGEAACLVLASLHGWILASDEKRRFRREAEKRLGRDRIIGTADLFGLSIRAGVLTIDEADSAKAVLEKRRFRMPFQSFRDYLGLVFGESE